MEKPHTTWKGCNSTGNTTRVMILTGTDTHRPGNGNNLCFVQQQRERQYSSEAPCPQAVQQTEIKGRPMTRLNRTSSREQWWQRWSERRPASTREECSTGLLCSQSHTLKKEAGERNTCSGGIARVINMGTEVWKTENVPKISADEDKWQ